MTEQSVRTVGAPEPEREDGTRDAFPWARVARVGTVTMVVWSVALQGFAGEPIPPVAVIGLMFLGFSPFVRPGRRRVSLALAIVAALALAGNIATVVDELSHPESAPAFILTSLSVLGVTLAIVGGLGSFFGWAAGRSRTVIVGLAGVFALSAVASLAIAAGTESHQRLDGDIEVVASGISWEPENVTVEVGGSELWIDNRDGIRHTFTITELGVNVDVPALKSRRVALEAPPGTYTIFCTVPGHETMTGTLTVAG